MKRITLVSLQIFYLLIPVNIFSPQGSTICSTTAQGTYYDAETGLTIACGAGQYDNGTACVDCPAGFSCAGFNAAPMACANNTYQDQIGSSACRPCPGGQMCLNPASSPVDCVAGQFSPEGDSTCRACPDGFYSSSMFSQCIACPAGFSCVGGTRTECVAGTFSSRGDGQCTSCSSGEHTDGDPGATTCLSCPAGFQCLNISEAPTQCSDGQYSPSTEKNCLECPAGHSCPNAEDAPQSCPRGTFSTGSLGSGGCDDCPAGRSCLDPSGSPLNCDTGSYSLVGDAICKPCPAGSECIDTISNPASCAEGYFSLAGNGTCYPCPSGYFCVDPALSPVRCAEGTTTNGSVAQTSCDPCPEGYSCSDASVAPVSCGTGDYTPSGASGCVPCPAGASCTASAATACDAGTYSVSGQSDCTSCPAGKICPYTNQVVEYDCKPGTYSLGDATHCTACPAGKACPNIDNGASTDCGNGFYSFGGQVTCTPCSAGQACPNADGSGNFYCAPGTYALAEERECTPCTAGNACPFTDVDTEIPCDSGFFSGPGQTTCTRCPAGYACDTKGSDTGNAIQCEAGTYSGGGMASCEECLAGTACPTIFAEIIIICQAGTYSVAKAMTCLPCDAGTECPKAHEAPQPCTDGTYSTGRQASCTICPAGYQCSDKTSNPEICSEGTYALDRSITCPDCDAGYVCPEGSVISNPENGKCPIGFYCESGTTTAQPCSAGRYGATEGLKNDGECSECPEGYYCPEGTAGVPEIGTPSGTPSVQNLCPRGRYCPAGTTSDDEFLCEAGTYNTNTGQSAATACIACPTGRYCPAGSSTPGEACPRGHHCSDGDGNGPLGRNRPPTPCRAGTYTAEEGARSIDDCIACPAGYYCQVGAFNPLACANGTYQSQPEQGSSASCLDCTAGMVCSTTALTGPDGPCSPGYYCPKGTALATENPCPAGTFTDAYDLKSSDECSVCPVRFACLSGTGGFNSPPLNCAPGYYCKNGTEFTTQWPCPAGSYSNKTNLANFDECWECPRGSYCLENSTVPQGPCPSGHYCPAGTKFATEHLCQSGSFSNKTGNIRVEDCDDCLTGSYCKEGSSDPTLCEPGSYNPNTNGDGEEDCFTCDEGYYCPDNGTTDPLACSIGSYSGPGLAECLNCLAGHYCDEEEISTRTLTSNKICPSGMHCPPGTSSAPNLKDYACPPGFYCEYGDIEAYPVPCPIGKYSGKTGLKMESDCVDCTEGYYCDVGNLTEPAGRCPPGHYCPTGTGARDSNPCPPGTFLNGSAAVSSVSCTSCTSGHYCPIFGTSEPCICPEGSYCLPGVDTPAPCGAGTLSNRTGATSTLECTPCPGGFYCDGSGDTSKVTGVCDAGFYCISGSEVAAPVGKIYGDVCSKGGYCPEMSVQPTSCPAGSFSNITMAKSVNDCIPCPAGKFCSGISADGYTGDCSPGFYCPEGSKSATEVPTDEGYFAESGAPVQIPCDKGSYSPSVSRSSCLPCTAGQYCNETGMAQTKQCPLGRYCPRGSINPKLCPVGTYNDEVGQPDDTACNPCDEGFYCSQAGLPDNEGPCEAGFWCGVGSVTSTPNGTEDNGGPCPAGHYCESGTSSPTQCDRGTYNNVTKATNESFCVLCDPGRSCSKSGLSDPDGFCLEGYYCIEGATNPQPPIDSEWGFPCTPGHRCPTGSGAPIPCEPGTYNNETLRADCDECPEGYQCKGKTSKDPCPAGHYCPPGTNDTAPMCPPGTFEDEPLNPDILSCNPCSPGYYCDQFGATSAVKECEAGYYCRSGVNVSQPSTEPHTGDGGICPQGFYCPQNTGEPESCPTGTYSNKLGATEIGNCTPCDKGKFCTSQNLTAPEGNCTAGHYCAGGAITSTPTNETVDGGYYCPAGFHCPEGTPEPRPCPPGGYSDREGLAECVPCQAGFYCPEGTTDTTSYPCEPGYYCPQGTGNYEDYPCPPGTYGNQSSLSTVDSCFPCDPGKYCVGNGNTTWTGNCDPGYYCLTNSTTPTPSGISDYTDPNSCICPASDVGGVCPVGYFCPEGTGRPKPCTGGYYCEEEKLSDVSGPCNSGYYCNSTATRPDPEDGITGGECPEGSYCLAPAANPTPCPSGKFGNGTGLGSEDDCWDCLAGFYCPDLGQTESIDPCEEGYYCPAGQSEPNLFPCEPGYMCPPQSPDQVLCESGFYQDEPGKATCKPCGAGYYCDRADGPISDYTNYPCPNGSYCLEETKFDTETKCPEGRYGSAMRLTSPDQCDKCKVGRYCPIEGLKESDIDSNPDYECGAGYFCIENANISSPEDGVTGRPCSKGHYCPQGTTNEIECKIGTFNNLTGQPDELACIDCTGGFFCDAPGLEEPAGSCAPGYYCPGGNTDIAPENNNCTVGHYCPGQTTNPLPCRDGTYNKDMFATECRNCSEGYYCVDGLNEVQCPQGYYCPAGTGFNWKSCPLGTYGQSAGLQSEEDCAACDPGFYCDEPNATGTSGICDEKFYCRNGSSSATPDGSDGVNGLCSPGHYCPAGTEVERDCPSGKYYDGTGLAHQDECLDCLPGQYCLAGSGTPTGNCSGGFYCLGGASSPNNPIEDETGGPCPQGFFCPEGTSNPKSCPPGRYNNLKGQEECFECMAGYYCPENSSDYISNECPPGYFCPNGTKGPNDHPCPAGTFSNSPRLQDLRGCEPCKPGYFCPSPGRTEPEGKCSESWYCTSCSWSATPGPASSLPYEETSCLCPVNETLNSTGGQCKAGFFCPEGSVAPHPCTPGQYCETDGLGNKTSGPCAAGFYCLGGASSRTPRDGITGDECPMGHYCEEGSPDKVACPAGTFSNKAQNKKLDDCTICTAGFYCIGGETTESGPCQEEFYCPLGQNVSAPSDFQCTPGHRCPAGSDDQIPCKSGTYQSEFGKSYCDVCPEGYYCEAINSSGIVTGVSVPLDCDEGFFCPNGTEYRTQYGCEKGTYGNRLNMKEQGECLECDGGFFCGETGLKSPSGPCLAGFFCSLRAEINGPRDNITGNVCPLGHFCTNNTQVPDPCKEGSYGPSEGLKSQDDCSVCDGGKYCQYSGRSEPEGDCFPRYYCPNGSISGNAEPCPAGYHCPGGNADPLPCPIGSYTNESLQESCTPCDEGSYCNGTGIQDCPLGYYCPMGTGGTLEPCPRGTYGDTTGLMRVDQCRFCDPGFYCPNLHATSWEGPCDPGYFCRNGSDSKQPSGGHTGDAGVCPSGYFCESGTGEPIACDPGTFNSGEMATGPEFCRNCTAGMYCNGSGLSEPTGDCFEGYYCTGMSSEGSFSMDTSTGGPCPPGYSCPEGSSIPRQCVNGSFTNESAMGYCIPCEAGFYCPVGAVDAIECTVGHYCEYRSTWPVPCNNGTYNNETGSTSPDACQLCDPGKYCPDQGMEYPEGDCAPGWYCSHGSWMRKPVVVGLGPAGTCSCPAEGGIGGRCEAGEYCPEGGFEPISCDPGYFCDRAELDAVTDACKEGYFCSGGSTREDPTGELFGDICPPGTYCPRNSSSSTDCPSGTYSSEEGNTDVCDCEQCEGGWYCPSPGLNQSFAMCEIGFFCPPGSTEKAPPTNECPNGTECPPGSPNYTPCYSGTYQPERKRGSCLVCETKKYCDYDEAVAMGEEGVVTPQICPPGFFCPRGTNFSTEHPCPPGRYGPTSGLGSEDDCSDCDGGMYCGEYNQTSPTDFCYPGYYCPLGSSKPDQELCPTGSYCEAGSPQPSKCPQGMYGASPNLGALDQCTPCDPGSYCGRAGLNTTTDVCSAGFYCSGNSTEPNPNAQAYGDRCPPGAYCPSNTSQPILCPSGTFNPEYEKGMKSDCIACTQGYFCNGTGMDSESGACLEGFYCNGSATVPTESECPLGHHCPPGSPEPVPCLNGTYANTTKSPVCATCPAGSYCIDGAIEPFPCPKGQYCPEGTGLENNLCPKGTFNDRLGISSEVDCTQCKAGYYCGTPGKEECCSESERCLAGYNCVWGVDISNPDNTTNKGYGERCQPGFQCPNGSAQLCPPGTYARGSGLDLCEPCDAGFYCDGGTINPDECLKGHFCPEGTKYSNEYPCPAGTYNNKTGQSDITSCDLCAGGMFCDGEGNDLPDDFCLEGYYCLSGSDSPTPEVTGNTVGGGSETCSNIFDCVCPELNDTRGGLCPPGNYCPHGTTRPSPCDRGKYCPDFGMTTYGENCTAGYYCPYGSSQHDEEDCQPGYYCESGTPEPTPCASGTYSETFRNIDESRCLSCKPGMYCNSVPSVTPTANCTAGRYCPGGDTVPTNVCRVNHYCPEGSINETVCEAGTYQRSTGQSFCDDCPSGKLCDPDDGNLNPENCPIGFFCPLGTPLAQPCPRGKFGEREELRSEADCTFCTSGHYCNSTGASEPTGECYAGYYCTEKATQPDPFNDTAGSSGDIFFGNGICPIGHFCLNGSSQPRPCPRGTFSMEEGVEEEGGCQLCPAGRYCDSSGRTEGDSAPQCQAGFVCIGGADTPTPNDGVTGYPCPKGFHCPEGTPIPLGCPPGYYSESEGSAVCDKCQPGTFCSNYNTSSPEDCWPGFYCESNATSPAPCPEGTFNNQPGSATSLACLLCEPGFFCNGTGNSGPDGPCSAGYHCNGGSTTPTPNGASETESPYNGPCPVGKYCEEGVPAPTDCPRGTIRNRTGARSEDECDPCTPGYFCNNAGLSEPTAKCECGYYCPGTAPNWSPTQNECEAGFQCPEGSIQQKPCSVGSYQPNAANCDCDLCPAGSFCNDTLSGGQTPCPPYSFCPTGASYPLACPNGTYTFDDEVGLRDETDCRDCPAGKYCNGGKIQDDCAAGYLCISRAYSATANENLVDCGSRETCAGPCPAGSYCVKGTTQKTPCPENTLRSTAGASQASDCEYCPPGQWCHEGDPVSEPCPAGFFCQGLNTSDCDQKAGPQPCRVHTFNNETGGQNKDDCLPCPAGFWCNDTGLSDFSLYACELGYYCVGGGQSPTECPAGTLRSTTGATSVDDCTPCTPGYYCPHPTNESDPNINGIPCERGYQCPEGSISPLPCTAGFYCVELTSDPAICPPGYFCPEGSYSFQLCEYPYYCPEGTGTPLPCDVGYQPLNISGPRSDLDIACMICPPGSYRNSSLADKCEPCPPGYYCPEGTGNFQENPCPVGHYCPEGGITEVGGVTGQPIPCPPGTFGQQAGSEFSVCQSCAPGMYNNREGQTACFPCGSSAESTGGAIECTCEGFNRAFQPSDGACVCISGYIYYDEVDQIQSEGNAPFSCEALVDIRCASDEARIASDRACAVPSTYSCESTCGTRGGTLNVDRGTCLCDTVTVPEEIECYDCNTMGAVLDTSTGTLTITTTSTTNSSDVSTVDVPDVFGPADRVVGPANTLLVQMSPQGVFAVPPTSPETAASVVNGDLQQDISNTRRRRSVVDYGDGFEDDLTISRYIGRKILQTVSDNSTAVNTLPIIANPILCLQLGEMLIFNVYVDQDDRSLSNYPVYLRNHLFNTNPSFDYGAFRQLEVYITQSNWNVSNFAHVFLQSGIFVFRDSQETGQELIVNVLANGLLCDAARIQPATEASLTRLGVGKQSVSNLTPDWVLIIVLLALFLACVIVLVIAIIVWRPRDAGIFPMKYWMPRYRSLGEPYLPPHKGAAAHPSQDSSEGLGLIRERGEAEGAEANALKDEKLLEDFNVRTLYDKLEDQNLHLSSQLDKHQDSIQGFYEKISNQTDGLKSMLNKLDVSKLQTAELLRSGASDVGATVVNTSLHKDLKLAGGQSLREKELLQSLEALINKLNTGKITVSDEILNDARNRLKGIDDKETARHDKSSSKKDTQRSDDWKVQGQESLIRDQESDVVNLDRELISGEREAISSLLINHDDQRKKLISDMNDKLAFKMQGDLSDKEMEQLLSEHSRELENALGALSRERERQMRELKEQLAAKRRKRANQLNQTHKEQCDDVGMPAPPSDDSALDEENLSLMEKELEAALLKESALASKEEQDLIVGSGKEDGAKISKSFEDELDMMVQSGLITDEVRDKLRQQIIEQENDLDNRMKAKRDMQIKAMRDRMAERKKRRMKKLQGKQEKEKAVAIKDGEYTEEMKERHQAEMEALEAEMDAEAATMEKDMNESIELEHVEALKEIHREIIEEMSDKHGVDPVQQQELLDRYRRELDNYDHLHNVKKATQAQNLQAQLAARRARRAAEVQKTAERRKKNQAKEDEKKRLEELARMREEEAAREEEQDDLDLPSVMVTDNLEVQALAKEQERILAETDHQQVAEIDKLMLHLDKKEKEDLDALERRLKEEEDKKFTEASAKHEAEVRARTDLTEEQIQQLLAAHQQELDELSQSMKMQQDRQRANLQEKLAARRKRKTTALHSRQDIEKEREELEQRKEMAQVHAKTAKEAERKAIIEGIERNGAAASEKIIQKVLDKRHRQELKDLEDEFALKKKMLIEDALKLIKEQYQADRDALLSKHESEMLQLENERLPTEEFERRKKELLKKQSDELDGLDEENKQKCKGIEEATTAEWKLDYAQAKLKLKEKHYQEYADALRELAPSASQQQTAEEAEEAARKIEETKQKLELEREKAEKQLADDRKMFEDEEKQRMAKALQDFEKELELETEQDKLKAEKTLNNLVQRKEKLLHDKKNKMREEMERAAAAGASEEEQKKILDQHEKDVENLTNKLDRERLRMKTQLEERLKKRRKEKIDAKKTNLQKESEITQKEIDAKQKAELQKIQEKQVETLQKTAEKMEKADKDRRALEDSALKTTPKKVIETPQTAAEVPPPAPDADLFFSQVDGGLPMMPYMAPAPSISEKDLHEMLSNSPLYHTLQEIQGVLHEEKKTGRLSDPSASGFVGPDAESIHTELLPTPLADLSTRELVAYKFGTFILTLLRTRRPAHPPVNLLVAEKVPAQPELKQNAFRGSFCFDEGNAILYVKRDRLTQDSIGRLSLLLVHAMAHLAISDFESDNSTAFLQEFYQCLAVLSDDLFFARYKAEPKDFEKDVAGKINLSQDLLDVKLPSRDISTPSADSLRGRGLEGRMEKYVHSIATSSARGGLGKAENQIYEAKSSGIFDEVDSKLSALLPSTPSTSQSVRRPETRDASSVHDQSDLLNAEFVELSREAEQLHNVLDAGDETDKVTVRNRLNNVQIKLSDVQKRLRSVH